MKTDETLRREIRTALDRRLSDVVESPDSKARMRRLIQGEEKIVKKKLSMGFVIVVALLLATMTVALATGGFGLLDYKKEQAENKTFIEHIVPVGQTNESAYLNITVNEAVFNGTTLAFTLDIAPKDPKDPVYVIPTITAEVNWETVKAEMESSSGNFSPSGFWVPEMDPRMESTTQFGVEATLPHATGSAPQHTLSKEAVTWHLSFEVLHPRYPISYAQAAHPADDSGEELTDEMEDEESYNLLFAEAYADHRILLSPEGSLLEYVVQMPQPDGIPGGEKSWLELQTVLEQSDAFTVADCAVITFTTDGVPVSCADIDRTFDLADGWQAKVTALRATFNRVDYAMTLTRDASDGLNAAQAYLRGERWCFAVLAKGVTVTPHSFSSGVEEDGSVCVSGSVELSAPATRVTFVPCREDETWKGEPGADGWVPTYSTDHMVYQTQSLYTDEQRTIAFSIDIQE